MDGPWVRKDWKVMQCLNPKCEHELYKSDTRGNREMRLGGPKVKPDGDEWVMECPACGAVHVMEADPRMPFSEWSMHPVGLKKPNPTP